LILYHWQREEDIKKDYEYAQFNKKINIIEYSEDEYMQFISDLDHSWTKNETDYLWNLCKQFDLRFIIIHDRYDSGYNRSIEDLKNRYYTVSRKILEVSLYFINKYVIN